MVHLKLSGAGAGIVHSGDAKLLQMCHGGIEGLGHFLCTARGNLVGDEQLGIVDENAGRCAGIITNDLAPFRCLGLAIHACHFHGLAVDPDRMPIHSTQHHGAIGNHFIEHLRGGKCLAVPQHLIPSPAAYPFQIRICRGEIGDCIRALLGRRQATQLDLEQAIAEPHQMSVGVDQARQQRAASRIDRCLWFRVLR